MYAHPIYWPFMWYAMWMNAFMAPWMKPMAGLPPAAAAIPAAPVIDPAAAAVGLDPASPHDLGSSATDFR
jgi:hypothetical protein